jgi:hypothetical protein
MHEMEKGDGANRPLFEFVAVPISGRFGHRHSGINSVIDLYDDTTIRQGANICALN